jgi:phosphoglycerol transferase MdoB-like AlkP superfamily enzyme
LYLFFLNGACSLLFVTHSLYLSYFDDFASVYHLNQAHLLKDVLDVVVMIMHKEIFFIADLIFLPFVLFKFKTVRFFKTKERIIAWLVLVSLGIYCMISASTSKLPFSESIYHRYDFANERGIITYQVFDIYYYLLTRLQKAEVTQEDVDTVERWFKEKGSRVPPGNEFRGIGKGFNLIVIQVESLQNFVIGKSYNGREVTPNLNRLADEGIYFENIYDQTAAGGSSDSTLLVNSSLYPSRKGAVSYLYYQNHFDSLPRILMKDGYATATLHAYKKNFWNSEAFEGSLGFQYQFYEDTFSMTDKIGGFLVGLSDRSFFLQSLEKIEQLPVPFYVFMRTLSTHAPFAHITSELDDFPLDDLEGEIIGYYLRSMHYVDSAIGDFLRVLSESNVRSSIIVVVYGDHRARLPSRDMKRIGVYDMSEKRKIPLIINVPAKRLGLERDTIGGLIDVAPTLCNILGIDVSPEFFLGRDLLNSNESFVIFRDGSYFCDSCSVNITWAEQQLMISDLILEKDMLPVLRNEVQN